LKLRYRAMATAVLFLFNMTQPWDFLTDSIGYQGSSGANTISPTPTSLLMSPDGKVATGVETTATETVLQERLYANPDNSTSTVGSTVRFPRLSAQMDCGFFDPTGNRLFLWGAGGLVAQWDLPTPFRIAGMTLTGQRTFPQLTAAPYFVTPHSSGRFYFQHGSDLLEFA
jgi:hypothetical protein